MVEDLKTEWLQEKKTLMKVKAGTLALRPDVKKKNKQD